MGRKSKKIIVALALLSGISFFLFARADEEEKYVRLVKAQSVNIITDADGKAFRKAVDATFLHNGTLLICDTAYWRVDENIINAKGNVRLSQEGTELTSEKLDYYVNDNLAQFRGGVVQLRDKENNILRTHFLDYNTADSVAVFSKGASMKDKDGQIIESLDGTYSSKAKLFTFEKDVNMFTDSVFIKTQALDYHTDSQKAVFRTYIDFWKDDNMLTASSGWYERNDEIFFFTGDVHGTTDKQETWCDSLYFYRIPNNVLMKGSIQLQDSLHNTTAVSRYLFYEDSLSTVTLRKEAAVAIVTEDDLSQKDTLYFGADTLVYYTLRHCDIPKSELANSTARISEIMTDPVGEYRKKAAEAAAKAQAEALEKAAGTRPGLKPDAASKKQLEDPDAAPEDSPKAPEDAVSAPADNVAALKDSIGVAADSVKVALDSVNVAVDSLGEPKDSLSVTADSAKVALDSLSVAADSVSVAVDTTKYGFAFARGNVKIFRRDIQVRCDSMHYSDLDSIARFYKDPVIWNEENRQYYSDSLAVLIKKGRVDRASLMSNAFVVTQEDSLLYDQIKSAEIMAFFDSTSALKRFDALGGATAVFFLRENDRLATVNKVESKMLSGNFVKGNIDRIYYYDSPKNDAYPVVQFPQQERYLKGFRWIPELRPTGKQDITTLSIRPSQRKMYAERPRARFKQTDIYFPGYIKSVYASIDARERARAEAARKKHEQQALEGKNENVIDTLAVKDSTMVKLDSTAVTKVDSLSAQVDSTSVDVLQDSLSSKKSFIQKIKDKFEQWRKQREERWARLDERDAAREAAKKEKALKKQREKTRKELIERQKQERREKEILDKYIEYYEKQKKNE
ncbi:MAG: OstA-like protein [Bacteroidales bacterium]|nr:OstA-like protein [Bacteroidales bacterium]